MAMNSIDAIINHTTAIHNMICTQLAQERKRASNARCKPADWDSVALYIEYATGVKSTGEEVRKAAHFYKAG